MRLQPYQIVFLCFALFWAGVLFALLLVHGQNRIAPISSYMPPVGLGWSDRQFNALFAYVKRNIYKAAPSGG